MESNPLNTLMSFLDEGLAAYDKSHDVEVVRKAQICAGFIVSGYFGGNLLLLSSAGR